MRKYFYLVIVAVAALLVTVFSSCVTSSDEVLLKTDGVMSASPSLKNATLSLDKLPAAGYVDLDPVNSTELDRLGLGGPSPVRDPPSFPFNRYGMYWSEPFSLLKGDILQITVDSDSPVSWFGVDRSPFDVRGILATTEMDEDGRAFDPQYPAHSSLDEGRNGYKLVVSYKVTGDTDCVLVVKNHNPDNSRRLSMSVSLKPSISLKRILRSIPVLKDIITSDHDEMEV